MVNEQENPQISLYAKETQKKLEELRQLEKKALLGGGVERIETQHKKNKLTARERIALLLDPGTFNELDMFVVHHATIFGLDKQIFLGDAVVTGYGRIDGRLVYVFAQDFTVIGGSLSEAHSKKICKIMDLAMKNGAPIIGLNDSGGGRIQEGVVSQAAYGEVFLRNTLASGVIPQISAIMGPCAGGAAYSPAITDFILMVEQTSYMFVTGPSVLKTATYEEVTLDELGGANVHNSISGVAHFSCPSEVDCLRNIRQLLSYIPSNNVESPPYTLLTTRAMQAKEAPNSIMPDRGNQVYDMRTLIKHVADNEEWLEIQKHFAMNILIGFIRLNGLSIGILAQPPELSGGALDNNAAGKAARFVRFCNSFNIPIITLLCAPGFLQNKIQEEYSNIRHIAKLLYAYCEATVPKITVITDNVYDSTYSIIDSNYIRADITFAWSTVKLITLTEGENPSNLSNSEVKQIDYSEQQEQIELKNYKRLFENFGGIIEPSSTHTKLTNALETLKNKKKLNLSKKHDNIPL